MVNFLKGFQSGVVLYLLYRGTAGSAMIHLAVKPCHDESMDWRPAFLLALLFTLTACAELEDAYRRHAVAPGRVSVDRDTQVLGLKQALEQGTVRAVSALGRENGYFRNPQLKIPMPENLARIDKSLRHLGQGKYADEFVLSMNRAAERAAPEAKAVFINVIRGMTFEDAVSIVRGPNDAATAYFRKNSQAVLTRRFHPVVAQATDRVGVTRRYKAMVQHLGAASMLVDTRNLDIDAYITQKALDGLFFMIAQEELRIRQDPLARTTEILRRVFR